MTARTMPTMPDWTAGQRVTGAGLQQITTYARFWTSPPMFRMYQTIAQSIPNATDTQITCDTVSGGGYDTDSGRAAGTPWSYVIPVGMTGRWEFDLCAQFSGNAAGTRQTKLFVNGVLAIGTLADGMAGPAGISTGYPLTVTIPVNSGDSIGLYAYQTSGGALNSNVGGNIDSYLEGRLVSLASP